MAASLVVQSSTCRPLFRTLRVIHKTLGHNNLRFAFAYSTKAERKARRQELVAEFKRGSYFADIREFQRNGGKRFSAPSSLFSFEESVAFPAFTANALSKRTVNLEDEFRGNVTLLLIAMRGIAQPMCDKYREAFQAEYREIKGAKYFEVNVVEHWFYGLFRSFVSQSLRRTIPKDRHDNFLCFYNSLKALRNKELLGNVVVGHAYLIDRKGMVRWKACAEPTEEELVSLSQCTKLLLP